MAHRAHPMLRDIWGVHSANGWPQELENTFAPMDTFPFRNRCAEMSTILPTRCTGTENSVCNANLGNARASSFAGWHTTTRGITAPWSRSIARGRGTRQSVLTLREQPATCCNCGALVGQRITIRLSPLLQPTGIARLWHAHKPCRRAIGE